MGKLFNYLLLFIITTTVYSQEIKEINMDAAYVLLQHDRVGEVKASLELRKTLRSDVVVADLMTMIDKANEGIQLMTTKSREYIPLSYSYKVKKNKSGNPKKQKYSLHIQYETTNAYNGAMNDYAEFEFNAKLKETVGSLMLRAGKD